MCGRFDQSAVFDEYLENLGLGNVVLNSQIQPRFNVGPGTFRPVIHQAGDYLVDDMHWGYQASWAADKIPMAINTRLEKITGRYWAPLLKRGRAIVPANGWYEWTGEKGQKQPWHIHRRDRKPLFLAALANFGEGSENKAATGFTIVTADSVGGMVDIHDRRPVVFSAEDALVWIDEDLKSDFAEQLARTQALDSNEFEWFEVSKAVGNARNESPQFAERITDSSSSVSCTSRDSI